MWVARDKNNELYLYDTKPEKYSIQWLSSGNIIKIDKHLCSEAKWVDRQPLEVEIVPKTNQREKHEESKSIDWEQRRYEIAKAAMVGELTAPIIDGVDSNPSITDVAKWSVMLADALIEELIKEE